MEIIPVNRNIIVQIDKNAEVMSTGAVSAHSKGERTASQSIKAIIVSMSEDADKVLETPQGNLVSRWYELKVGQTVWIQKWEGQELKYEGKEYIWVKPEHILGILPIKNQ